MYFTTRNTENLTFGTRKIYYIDNKYSFCGSFLFKFTILVSARSVKIHKTGRITITMNETRPPMYNDSNSCTAEELEERRRKTHVAVYLERAVHGPEYCMSYEHMHTYCEIFYLRRGSCVYTVNKGHWHLESGDIFIVAPGDAHSTRYEGADGAERIIVFCDPDQLDGLTREDAGIIRQTLTKSGKIILNETARHEIDTLISQMLLENDLPQRYTNDVLRLEVLLLILFMLRNGIVSYETMSSKEGYSADIERALKYIALNYQQALTLEEVADYCGLSASYFSRKFRLVTGQTFKEHVNYIRVRQATQMLLTTDDSITKIALQCGFGSSNYFKDVFHEATSVSPREYRKRSGLHIQPRLRDNR